MGNSCGNLLCCDSSTQTPRIRSENFPYNMSSEDCYYRRTSERSNEPEFMLGVLELPSYSDSHSKPSDRISISSANTRKLKEAKDPAVLPNQQNSHSCSDTDNRSSYATASNYTSN